MTERRALTGKVSSRRTETLYNDGSTAASYASTYAYNPNSCYYHYAGSNGSDCANFVSQCIRAGFGGRNTQASINAHQMMTNLWKEDQYGEFNGAWIRVNDQWNYMVSNKGNSTEGPRVSVVGNIKQVYLGRVVQFNWASNGAYDHSAIVVGNAGTGNPIIAEHSNNDKQYSLNFPAASHRYFNPNFYRLMM